MNACFVFVVRNFEVVSPSFLISMVMNMSDGAIRFLEGVVSLDAVSVAVLAVFLVVTGVRILHFVLVLVLRMSLEFNVMVIFMFFFVVGI